MSTRASWGLRIFSSLFFVPFLSAQTAGTGALAGTVTDSSGRAIPGAMVTATNTGNGQSRVTTTQEFGNYRFSLLQPGVYKVKFEAAGFAATEVPSVQIAVTETPVLDRSLNVASETQTVTVDASAEIIQTASSTLGAVVGSSTVSALPLSTRNYVNLIAMSAGANADVNDATALGKGWLITSVNGANNTQNSFQMDGAPINNWASFNVGNDSGFFASLPVPNPDAIQEFKIQTSGYDAGYGRNAGANVNVITKSGTNTFHGSAFEFFRNTVLNANQWFNKRNQLLNGQPNKRSVLNQNQFGGTLGGPIKKDKMFFFTSYQETRQKNGISAYGFSGVFLPPIPGGSRGSCPSGWSLSSQCDATAQNFIRNLGAANCTAPTLRGGLQVGCDGSNINPVAVNLLQLKLANGNYYVPSPTTLPAPGSTALSTFSDPAIYRERQLIANWDYLVNEKHTLIAHYVYSTNPTTAPFSCAVVNGTAGSCLPGAPVSFSYPDHAAVLKLTSALRNNLVNEARVSFQKYSSNAQNLVPFNNSQVGIKGFSPQLDQLTGLNVTNQFVLGANSLYGLRIRENQFQYADQVSWTRDRHTFRMGGEYANNAMGTFLPSIQIGQPTFPTFVDFLIGRGSCAAFTGTGTCSATNAGNTNGTSVSNLSAIGNNVSIRAFNGQLDQTFKAKEMNLFIQDDWRLSSRLTVNLGLRWEYGGYAKADDGGWSDPWTSRINAQEFPGNSASTGTLVGYVVPANFPGTIPAGVAKNSNDTLIRNTPPRDNFGPRVGFAWQPLASTKRVVVRGGGGVFFDRINGHNLTLDGITTEPYGVTPALSPNASLSDPFVLPDTIPGPAGTPGWPARWANFTTGATSNLSGRGIAETLQTPTIYQWNVNVQTEFLPKWVLELGYVGARGIHITSSLPTDAVTAGGNRPSINLAELASPSHPLHCGYDGDPSHCITTNTTANLLLRVPYLGYSTGFRPYATVGEYKFNSLQATVRTVQWRGVQFQAAYTWSGADINYRIGNPAATEPGIAPEISVYGPNSQYRPHRLVMNYGWALPFGKHKGVLGVVATGWTWSGVAVVQSGTDLVISDRRDGSIFRNSGGPTGLATYCAGKGSADLAASGSLTERVSSGLAGGPGYFNRGVFCAPLAVGNGTGYGGDGLGPLRGPGQSNWDMSLAKMFKVWESQTLEFRTEFFNTFNHPQFQNPIADPSASSFGQIGATSVNPRLIQFALKYLF